MSAAYFPVSGGFFTTPDAAEFQRADTTKQYLAVSVTIPRDANCASTWANRADASDSQNLWSSRVKAFTVMVVSSSRLM